MSSSSSSSLGSLGLNSDDPQDLQFQAEMNCYAKLYAKVSKVREREHQRLELEALKDIDSNTVHGQSDGELLVLASSLFNGMDSAESNQDIGDRLGDVEMGRADQIKTKTSPRRTRSGKIVNYRDS